jgi:hypothetical protein
VRAARISSLGALLIVTMPLGLLAQEQAADDAASKQRMELMEQTIAGIGVQSDAIASKAALKFAAKPLLRYSDPTRGTAQGNILLDATVWRLGESGRPTALVTLEIYRSSAELAMLSYEFASLAEGKFTLKHKQHEKVAWIATGSAAKMSPLADAPMPAATAAGRLIQMRQLARQFSARETLFGESIECRLLAQPIDRYSSPETGLVDGAIFAFANGTNPELGLVLECDKERWSYGVVRLSAAGSVLEYAGREVANFPPGDFRTTSGTYSATAHDIALPQ